MQDKFRYNMYYKLLLYEYFDKLVVRGVNHQFINNSQNFIIKPPFSTE
jgi:hypothetical protein